MAGGGFADIFRASYRGEDVALKRLRDFQVHQRREIIHRVGWRDTEFSIADASLPFRGFAERQFYGKILNILMSCHFMV